MSRVQPPPNPITALSRLIYCSRAALKAGYDLDEVVGGIVRNSVIRNQRLDLSGVLLVHDGWFVQALEGPASGVKLTYDRIRFDARHTDVKLIGFGPIAVRSFSQWHMCERKLSAADASRLYGLSAADGLNPAAMNEVQALRLLEAVTETQVRTLLPLYVD